MPGVMFRIDNVIKHYLLVLENLPIIIILYSQVLLM